MALRAFQANPSIGGFGGESQLHDDGNQILSARGAIGNGSLDQTNNGNGFGVGSGDAFAQIVKELVDNAVDACTDIGSNATTTTTTKKYNDEEEKKIIKRVRVDITVATVQIKLNANANVNVNDNDIDQIHSNTTDDEDKYTKTIECLRVVISDNGCGMENIDDCVTAFRSNKIGPAKQNKNNHIGGDDEGKNKSVKSSKSHAKKKKQGGKKQTKDTNNENYTSGRYGVGLTLCLLHAQRLVPGCGVYITSATASATEWTRSIYEPDTEADDIVCQKTEHLPKVVDDECGTTISLYVPGGEDAKRAWPRLAEYFARFQLSIDLPCSLEVKAPTLQSRPLYIRPPAEIERRMKRRGLRSKSVGSNASDTDNDSEEERSHTRDWEGGDGFGEENSLHSGMNQQQPKMTKAAQQRADAELEKKKKISLICKAAAAYKGRPDVTVDNAAYSTQPIRRPGQSTSSTKSNGPTLEVGLIVFGPDQYTDKNSDDEHSDDGSHQNHQCNGKSDAKLQIVRMVNGIPLLDSSEALACGVVQKISNNSSTWNSFGLVVSNENGLDSVPVSERNTPTFTVSDSAQVAPFLKSTTHSLFRDETREDNQSSSEDEEFDMENFKGKRKKERDVRCLLPAALRLGDVLMVVQIRAKPSSLPLPTLSKGRLPLNDKGISDALENGITDCLRCLQKSSPGLLLTAHQLKRVERDVKYAPSVAASIASVLCRSKQRGVYNNVMNIVSGWNEEGKCSEYNEPSHRSSHATMRKRMNNPGNAGKSHDEDRLRIETLRPMLEQRLKFVISDEFKDAKRAEEKERQRQEREELIAAKKRAKKNKAAESDGMKGDCFESDDADFSVPSGTPTKSTRKNSCSDSLDSDVSSPLIKTRRRRSTIESDDSTSKRDSPRKKTWCRHDSKVPSPIITKHHTRVERNSPAESSDDGFNSELSSPIVKRGRRQGYKRSSMKRSIERGDYSLDEHGDDDRSQDAEHCDGFGDGYESSSVTSDRQKVRGSIRDTSLKRLEGSSTMHDDAMSSDSEWSSQINGEVVAGHFFR